MDRIAIRNLRVETRIGATEAERSRPQHVLVTVEILFDAGAAAASDDLADTIDYGETTAVIAELVRSTETRLLEALAGKVAAAISAREDVRGVTVEIAKESPPIAEDIDEVSVRIERPKK